jgi:acyl-CoA synthetase (NDP forming)
VALVGASGDSAKNTARPQRYLRKHGYTGRIFPVNPSRKEIFSEPCFPSVREIPEAIDHALIMVQDVEAALEDCAKRGVPVASIYSDGFADAGPQGAERQARLVARARDLGVRLLGPNSMGVIDIPGRLALTVNAVVEMDSLPSGGMSLVSQSGTMLGTLLSRGAARGLGFAKLVSVGNEADLGVGELVDLLADDAGTRVILLFLETVRDAARLASAARRAHAAGKPVVAYKLGRSAAGEALARSHTGALAGSDRALDAYFRDCGIVRVDMLETLLEIAPLVSNRIPLHLNQPPKVAVVTTTGGGAATVVDRLGLLGIETVSPDGKPIVDLTMAATPEKYRKVLEELLEWNGCDAVLAAVGSSVLGRLPSRSPRSSRRMPSAHSRFSPSAASPASAPRKPARTPLAPTSPGARRASVRRPFPRSWKRMPSSCSSPWESPSSSRRSRMRRTSGIRFPTPSRSR